MEPLQPAGAGDVLVGDGDSISSIARAAGFLPDSLWDDPVNASLKEARGSGEVLLPGDRVTVRAPRFKKLARPTGQRHVFRKAVIPCTLCVILQDAEGQPLAGKAYELVVGDMKLSGTTDDLGKVECAVDPTARRGTLKVWVAEPGFPDPWERELRLGSLHPQNCASGVQQRLANLGFYLGSLDGQLDEETLGALAAFAAAQKMDWTGDVDAPLAGKLVELHGV